MSLSALCNTAFCVSQAREDAAYAEDEETRRDRAPKLEGSDGVGVWMRPKTEVIIVNFVLSR